MNIETGGNSEFIHAIQNPFSQGDAMKTVFVVNPKAGQGEHIEPLLTSIREAIKRTEAEGEIYLTKGVGDATSFVENYCKGNDAARFLVCGGDGTLSEVLNGVMGYQDAEIGVIPMGTGNDFCRNFGKEYDFFNLDWQLTGESILCDAIRYRTEVDGDFREGYCVNMFNIGFDCNVADLTAEMKKKPLLSGSFAYFISILITLIQKKTVNLKIELDGDMVHNGNLLLTSVANGSFCGGGIKSNPRASVTGGKININVIQNLSRRRFLSLLPSYMKGTILERSGVERYLQSLDGRHLVLIPEQGRMRLCVDGEIIDAGRTDFECVPSAFRFVLPGCPVGERREENLLMV